MEKAKTMYSIRATARLEDHREVRTATITVIEPVPHTSIDVLEEVRHLNKLGYTVTIVVDRR